MICVLIASWLGEGHRRWDMAAAVALAVGLAAAVPARAASLAQADAAYREGKYSDAARELTQLTQERPDDADLFQRLGAARYRAGDFEGAARAWSREAELRGDDLNTLFDLGNANARAGRLERALEYYDRVLEDRTLLRSLDREAGRRSAWFAMRTALIFWASQLGLMLRGQWHRFGYACVNFGGPISARDWLAARGLEP